MSELYYTLSIEREVMIASTSSVFHLHLPRALETNSQIDSSYSSSSATLEVVPHHLVSVSVSVLIPVSGLAWLAAARGWLFGCFNNSIWPSLLLIRRHPSGLSIRTNIYIFFD